MTKPASEPALTAKGASCGELNRGNGVCGVTQQVFHLPSEARRRRHFDGATCDRGQLGAISGGLRDALSRRSSDHAVAYQIGRISSVNFHRKVTSAWAVDALPVGVSHRFAASRKRKSNDVIA